MQVCCITSSSESLPRHSRMDECNPEPELATSGHAGLGGLRTFIFERRDDFPEILSFVRDMDARYGLRLEELEGDFRTGLANLIRHSGVKAIVLGTRRRGRPGRLLVLLCSGEASSLR